jgi:hypothetical protein
MGMISQDLDFYIDNGLRQASQERRNTLTDIFGHFKSELKELRLQALEAAKAKFSGCYLSATSLEKLGPTLMLDSKETWSVASGQCIDIILSHPKVAVQILLNMIQLKPENIVIFMKHLKPEHVARWLSNSLPAFEGCKDFTKEAWAVIIGESQRHGLDFWPIKNFFFHSVGPDARIARSFLIGSLGSGLYELMSSCHDLVDEAEKSASIMFKTNAVVTILETLSYMKVGKGGLMGSKFINEKNKITHELHIRVTELTESILEPWPFLGNLRNPSVALSSDLTKFILEHWINDYEDKVMCRYLSVIAGGYLANKFARDMLKKPRKCQQFRQLLKDLSEPQIDMKKGAGFFRPSSWYYLPYHVNFLVKALMSHTEIVSDYIISDKINRHLLTSAGWSRLYFAVKNWSENFEPTRFESEMNTFSECSGIDEFFKASNSKKIKYMDLKIRDALKQISKPVDKSDDFDNVLMLFDSLQR